MAVEFDLSKQMLAEQLAQPSRVRRSSHFADVAFPDFSLWLWHTAWGSLRCFVSFLQSALTDWVYFFLGSLNVLAAFMCECPPQAGKGLEQQEAMQHGIRLTYMWHTALVKKCARVEAQLGTKFLL